jgi:3-deoxy-D-manno-octulosonic-acid transferase
MIKITGNIKFDQESDPVSQEQADNLKQSLGINSSQKIFLAGSTHDKEESIILDAFLRLKESNPDIILIIVPRNPDRSRSVCSLCKFKGISAVTMTDLEEKKLKSDVIVINRMGILKTLYAIADMAFVGGSLVKCGGHNPLEPAAFSRPIIFGPDMSDFSDISKMLVESGGAVTVYDPESIYQTLLNLITNEEKARDMGKKAFDVFNKNKGAVDKTLNVVKQLIKS